MSDESVSRLYAILDEHGRSLARIETRIDALPCADHARALSGNGRPGLLDRMTLLEERDARRTRAEWQTRAAALAAVASVIGSVALLLTR